MNRTISIAAVIVILAALAYWTMNSIDMHSKSKAEDPALSGLNSNEKRGKASTNFAAWHEYIAPSDQFRVLMPTPPHYATENIADPKTSEMRNYQIFVSTKDDGSIFSVYLISFTDKFRKSYDEAFLENFMREMLNSNPKTNIKNIKLVDFRKGKAVDFDLETQDVNILGKAFLDGQTLYILSETTKPQGKDLKEFEFFVNSFQLTKPADSTTKK